MVSEHENQIGCSWNFVAFGPGYLAFCLPWIQLRKLETNESLWIGI